MFGFTLFGSFSAATAVLFGLLPAIRATSSALKASGRTHGTAHRRLLERRSARRHPDSAVCSYLLVFAALFVRSLNNIWLQDPAGYDRSNVVIFSVDAGLAGKRGPDAVRTYRSGARSAAIASWRDVGHGLSRRSVTSARLTTFVSSLMKVGLDPIAPESLTAAHRLQLDRAGYFATMRNPLLAGRDFDDAIGAGAPKVANIISDTLGEPVLGEPGRAIHCRQRRHVGGDWRRQETTATPTSRMRRASHRVFRDVSSEEHRIPRQPTKSGSQGRRPRIAVQSVRAAAAAVDSGLTVFQATTLEARCTARRDSLSCVSGCWQCSAATCPAALRCYWRASGSMVC